MPVTPQQQQSQSKDQPKPAIVNQPVRNVQPQPQYYAQPAIAYPQPQPPIAAMGRFGQPIQMQMLYPPPPIPGVPIGLEPIVPLSQIFIKQQVEMLEVLTGYETRNRYDVLSNGQRIYLALETTDAISLQCSGSLRAFTLNIVDFIGRTVLVMYRIDDGCNAAMGVNLMDGTRLGEIYQENCCAANFSIRDGAGQTIMLCSGPSGECCYSGAEYPITLTNGTQVGIIRKTFAGFVQEYMTDADNFGVEFDPKLDVMWKGLVFATVFLIDFMYFERGNQHQHHGYGYGHGGYGYSRW